MAWCTIVVPTFNGEPFVGDLIDSLAGQLSSDCDMIFLDDGSTDNTVSAIVRCGISPAKIISKKQNVGLYAMLNLAARVVDSEYMSILFQDDWVMHDYIAQMQDVSERYPSVSFLWPAINMVDGSEKRVLLQGLDTGREEIIEPGLEPWVSALKRGTFWTISGSVSKVDSIRRLRFREELPHCADYEMLLRALRAERFLYLERTLVNIRVHDRQASTGNLRKSIDLSERIQIVGENLSRSTEGVSTRLRIRLLLGVLRQIARRAVGQIGRRQFVQSVRTAALMWVAVYAIARKGVAPDVHRA
jgi:glycosyltransferase involved in cell wall biosynthesis